MQLQLRSRVSKGKKKQTVPYDSLLELRDGDSTRDSRSETRERERDKQTERERQRAREIEPKGEPNNNTLQQQQQHTDVYIERE